MSVKSKFASNVVNDDIAATPVPAGLQGYYLIRGFDPSAGALSSVMDLPKDDAIALMEKIHGHRGRGAADAAGKRDQSVYYAERQETDNWLRENAPAIKDRENPIFFALTNDPEFVKKAMLGQSNGVLVVPIEKVDLSKFSFTFDDSMGNYFSKQGDNAFLNDKHALHGTVMGAEKMAAALTQYGACQQSGQSRALEAQYWSKAPLQGDVLTKANDIKQAPAVAPIVTAQKLSSPRMK